MDGWCLLRPHQKWHDGEVLSPHELETIKEEDLSKYVTLRPAVRSASLVVGPGTGGRKKQSSALIDRGVVPTLTPWWWPAAQDGTNGKKEATSGRNGTTNGAGAVAGSKRSASDAHLADKAGTKTRP